MYYIYLYSENDFKRSGNNYGYWTGKTYIIQGEEYPIIENEYKRKEYKSLKRAIKGGEIAYSKYGYVCGFDIEDKNENIVYRSYETCKNKSKHSNNYADGKNETKEKSNISTPTLNRMLEIQEQSQLCGEFLDWFLHRYTVFDKRQSRETPFANVMSNSDYINKEKLLAEFFGIDLDEAEREKEQLLQIEQNKYKPHYCKLCGSYIKEDNLSVCDKCASEYQY